MEFRNWIMERFTPVVMVVSSPEADRMCEERNGLTVVDLLRPYGFFHHLSGVLSAYPFLQCQSFISCYYAHVAVPVRTVGEQSYRIREFRLRFFSSSTMYQPSREVPAFMLCSHLHHIAVIPF